ncbi:MAG: RNA polymerase sigma factor [Steroidobacterales bacterium]
MRLVEVNVTEGELSLARAGDAAAQQRIYQAVAPATLTLIRRFVGRGAISEDLFQDTMVTMYEQLAQFRGEAPFGAWLRQIAISRCLMYLRSPWRRARLCLAALELDTSAAALPLATVPVTPELIDVERALAHLPSTARAVVWMYEVEGFSHEEIGRSFGRSVSFSKSQLARAHARLRAWFAPPGTESHVQRIRP